MWTFQKKSKKLLHEKKNQVFHQRKADNRQLMHQNNKGSKVESGLCVMLYSTVRVVYQTDVHLALILRMFTSMLFTILRKYLDIDIISMHAKKVRDFKSLIHCNRSSENVLDQFLIKFIKSTKNSKKYTLHCYFTDQGS